MDDGDLDNVVEVGDIVYQTKLGPDESLQYEVLEVAADGMTARCQIVGVPPEGAIEIAELAVPWITKVED